MVHDICQHDRVCGIGFRSGHRIPGPVPRGGQRIDRVDHPATRTERGNPQAVIGFDPDRDQVLGGVAGFGECLEQSGEPGGVVADASAAHGVAQVVEDREVVMVFGPIDPRYSPTAPPKVDVQVANPCGARGDLIAGLDGPSSHQPFVSPAHRRALDLPKSSRLGIAEEEITPAAGSYRGISPRQKVHRPALPLFQKASCAPGKPWSSPGSAPAETPEQRERYRSVGPCFYTPIRMAA